MKKVLVTGATSYIAVELIKRLVLEGCYIYAVVRPNSLNRYKIPIRRNVEVVEANMADFKTLYQENLNTIDVIYHFAWEGVRGSTRDNAEIQFKNYASTVSLIDWAIDHGVQRFIGLGSQAEYGVMNVAASEDMEGHPLSEYGKQKVKVCQYGLGKCAKMDMKFIWGRLFSTYGSGENSSTLIMSCIQRMLNNEPIEMSPCIHLWDYVYLLDVVDLLWLFEKQNVPSGIYNIASGDVRPLREYVLELKLILKSRSELLFGKIPYGQLGPVNMIPDVTKVRKALEWSPHFSFHAGITDMLKRINE